MFTRSRQIALAAIATLFSAGFASAEDQSSHPIGETAASRLLAQASFGPTLDDVASASTQTYDQWFASQAALSPTLYLASVPDDHTMFFSYWLTHAVDAKDQLRQRMAFALSEILVVSANEGGLVYQNRSLAGYYDLLVKGALGNYRSLLEQITLSPAMGRYLSMFRNDKPDRTKHADENYAREVMQLFTVGLVQLKIDGTEVLDSSGKSIDTFTQSDVEGLARVLTGWGSYPKEHQFGEQSWQYDIDYDHPMMPYGWHHDRGKKVIIGGVTVPSGGSPEKDLKLALDTLFNHPNVGPFVSKQLIQRLVTSNPSPAYVARVATVFNDNGGGTRGDLMAVAKAILTDPEAVGGTAGKLREPLLRVTGLWRAFDGRDSKGMRAEYMIVHNGNAHFGEAPLDSPSVFNFFRPDYVPPTRNGRAEMFNPEMQITNENTLVLIANRLTWQAYAFVDSQGNKHAGYQGYQEPKNVGADSVMLHTAQWEPLAASPTTLVDKINLVLMQNQMPESMKATLVKYAAAIPASQPWDRVAEVAALVINSPQYSVQR